MARHQVTFETPLEVSAETAFAWHARPGAFERLVPPWERVDVVARTGSIRDGDRVTLEVRAGPLRVRWEIEHCGYEAGRRFVDVQRRGPFAHWEHEHAFTPVDECSCVLRDTIEFALPLGRVGRALAGGALRRRLERTFAYRQRVMRADLRMHAAYASQARRRVAVTGAGGLLGSAICALLTSGGHDVIRLVRRPPAGAGEAEWDPLRGVREPGRLGGVSAVIHLAGENIAAGRWTRRRKAAIRESRVVSTRALLASLARLADPPKEFICASAIGIYGDRGSEILTEGSVDAGTPGFLPEVCRAWEAEARAACELGLRWVGLRFGVVLSPAGGALARLAPVFRLGAGGRIGHGEQYMSWIALDDAIGAIYHALLTPALAGPVNVVAPEAVTNGEFARVLGRVLGRPAVLRVPGGVLRIVLGQLAQETILASERVEPAELARSGYTFRYPRLEGALRHVLGRVVREEGT